MARRGVVRPQRLAHWAYGSLDGVVPGARQLALERVHPQHARHHATLWPDHWDGTISVDDACYAYYSAHPAYCGNGLSTAYEGQITEQPTWMVMDAIDLAGVTPLEDGFQVTRICRCTGSRCGSRGSGSPRSRAELRGYIVVSPRACCRCTPSCRQGSARTRSRVRDDEVSRSRVRGGLVLFSLPAKANQPADWAVT